MIGQNREAINKYKSLAEENLYKLDTWKIKTEMGENIKMRMRTLSGSLQLLSNMNLKQQPDCEANCSIPSSGDLPPFPVSLHGTTCMYMHRKPHVQQLYKHTSCPTTV
jgi:hypothetical protein